MTKTHTRTVLALGLVAGPVLFTVGDTLRRIVDSDAGSSPTEITAAVHAHPGLWLTAALLELVAPLLTLPGLAALVSTARDRGRRTTVVGASLLAVGQVAGVGHAVAYFAPFALFAKAGTSPSQVRALDRASESWPALAALIVLFMAGLIIGTLVLFAGLRLARRVPIWAVVAALLFVVLGGSAGVVEGVLGAVAAAASFGAAAWSLVRPGPVAAGTVLEPATA